MTVDVREARAAERVVEYGSRTDVFCSKGCREEFEEAPDSYAGPVHEGHPEDS